MWVDRRRLCEARDGRERAVFVLARGGKCYLEQGVTTLKQWVHLSEPQVAALPAETVAILPLGAVEAHGPHLPTGTDTLIADGILDVAAPYVGSDVTVVRLPALWLGASVEHSEHAGTVYTPANVFMQQIDEVISSLVLSGVTRFVLFNAHGGNNPTMRISAMAARASHGALCAAVHWIDFGLPDHLEPPTPTRDDVHGGWMETSMMMALAPDLVGTPLPRKSIKEAPAPLLYPEGPVHWGWMSGDLGSDGFIGAPEFASVELGEALLSHAGQSLAALVVQLSKASWPTRKN